MVGDHGVSPIVLIWTPPVWQEIYNVGVKDLAAVLYPACIADQKPAGPDGIRRERPHLPKVLEGLRTIQVYFPAVRPVPPSFTYQPAQPFSCPPFLSRILFFHAVIAT